MSVESVVKDNLGFTWKHGAALILGGLVAFSLARRNFLGIPNAVDGLVGMVTSPLSNIKLPGTGA